MPIANWREFESKARDLAGFGERRFANGVAYLATVRKDGSPRVHPVSPFIGDGHLFIFMEPTSPKRYDLKNDGRFALHCAVEDIEGGNGEFWISGRAIFHADEELRAIAFEAARGRGFSPRDRYILFELGIEQAMATTYEDDQAIRKKWSASVS
jgi:hypothetical protein